MKTYKHLWDEFVSMENLNRAADSALRGKKNRKSAQRFMARRDECLGRLHNMLVRGEYKTGRYHVFKIFEPKERQIYKLPLYPDHIVHHALMNVLAPIWQKMFCRDSYACIPGRGLHAASRRCMQFVRRNQYVLQCDIRKFYPSINHDVMMRIIARKISDARILAVLGDIVRSTGGVRGMPIGNLTSQWMGNLYLNDLDTFVKQHLHVRDYIRYCDDFCLFGDNRATLCEYRQQLRNFLGQKLDLVFSKSFIKPVAIGVDFIGYRHFKEYVVLTRAGARKMRRKMRQLLAHYRISMRMRCRLVAFAGWMRWACCYNLHQFFRRWACQIPNAAFTRFFNLCYK